MYFNQSQPVAIASLLSSYLKFPVNAIVPQLKPKLPTFIEVERVGFTKNASNTPYLVYRVGDRRCCTFVKRRWFLECVQLLLKIKDGITDRIRTVSSSSDFGLFALTTQARQYIPSTYVNKFFTLLNWLLNCVEVEQVLQQPRRRNFFSLFPVYVSYKSKLNHPKHKNK